MSVVPVDDPVPQFTSRSVGPFAIGELVADNYEIRSVIGVGGMSVVYEALDRSLARKVAVKVPLFPAHTQALHAEAQALASLHHPAFVAVHHLGHHSGVDFLVMERIYGETLESRIDERRLAGRSFELTEVLDLLVSITDGVAAAHRAGVAHRDVKPANVILTGERTVLVDFGLFIPEVLIGPDNVAAGSAHYIAPEVLLKTVTKGHGPLIDLYAIGAIAYDLLTGLPPYIGETVERVLAAHVSSPVPDPRAMRADVPLELAALVRELLSKDPTDRPAGAEAVLWQLQHIRGRPIRGAAGTRVLVVDDDVHIVRALKRSLEQSFPQLTVEATTNPERALPRDQQAPAEVLVLDVDMPKTNGIEICMALAALPPERRPFVIVMSGSANREDLELLATLGVEVYLPKDASLLTAVGRAIGALRSGGRPMSLKPRPASA